MSTKLKSVLRLASRGDWSAIRARWHIHTAEQEIARAAGLPFVFHSFGFPFVCHSDWPDSVDQFANLAGDRYELGIVRDWLTPGDSAMDIGANLGFYALGMSEKVGPRGSVVAVDADSFAIDKLNQSIALVGQKQIAALRAAVADHNGQLNFYVRSDHSMTGTQSIRSDVSEEGLHTAVPTPCFTIDHIVKTSLDAENLAAIKIDVEGAEALAFRATPNALLSADGPLWLVEIHPGALARFDAIPSDITRHFPDDKFTVFLMPKHPLPSADGDTSPRRLTAGERYNDSLYYNMLAIPRGNHWSNRRRSIAHRLPRLAG